MSKAHESKTRLSFAIDHLCLLNNSALPSRMPLMHTRLLLSLAVCLSITGHAEDLVKPGVPLEQSN